MPGDFLPMLRQTNVLPRNRGSDRPFGMPEIDSGNVAAMFRQTIPLSESLKNQDMRRQQQMMQFERSLANQPSRGRGVQNFGGTSGAGMVSQPGAGSSGFSPMQRRFQEMDDTRQRQRFADEQSEQEISGKYRQALDERELMEEGAAGRNEAAIRGRYNVAGLQSDTDLQIEADKARYTQALEKQKHGYKLTEDEQRILHETRGGILRDRAKPPSAASIRTPKESSEALDTQLRRLQVEHPGLADAVSVRDGRISIDTSRLQDPRQEGFIQSYLLEKDVPLPESPREPLGDVATRRKQRSPYSARPTRTAPQGSSAPGMSNRPIPPRY